MTLIPLLLIGAGGHARSCIDVIEQEKRFAVVGLVGDAREVGMRVLGYPVLGTDAELAALLSEHSGAQALVTVGQVKTPETRMRLFAQLMEYGYNSPVIVSPHAHVSPHASVGAGTIVMHGAIVNAGAKVGRNCILNNQCLIEHDVDIADHCHISTAATINGGCRIGTGTFVGSGSVVRECISIGEFSLIGMGQRMLADCAAHTRIPAPKGAS